MKQVNVYKFFALGAMLLFAWAVNAQNSINGVVKGDDGEPLIGANVIVQGSSIGTVTGVDGSFTLNYTESLPVMLEVSYTGYSTQEVEVSSYGSVEITLLEGLYIGEEVVISASRRREKVQEAPAAISVISARKLKASAQENPVRNLINEPGVTIQQQSAGRLNIQLRGDGGLFGSATFPIQDYRSLVGPGLGTFDMLNSPVNNVDISRIEVVRGPGSALYGPGVTAGVIHFITKSAIDEPGTSIELIGGELNTIGGSFRHATKVSDKFGFKINGVFKRGDEFTLDPNDPDDAVQIGRFATTVTEPIITGGVVDATKPGRVLLTQDDLDPDGDGNMMQDFWRQSLLNATFEFRPQDDLSVVVAGGWNSASAVFYNSQGEGLSQADEIWTQARVQKGGLFAQAFWLRNNGGTDENPTFLYQTGNTTGILRNQLEGQLQYNFDTPSFLNANWTAGFDYRQSTADTKNQVYGREEDDDDFSIIGGYIQGKLELSKKFDFVVAARADKFNFLDDLAFSPRAVMVYKPDPKHTFRFGYNRAVGAPSQLQVNIDFPVSSPVPGAFDIWLLGNKNPQTFADNPEIVFNGALGVPNIPVGTPGFPNAFTYGAVSAPVLEQLIPGLIAAMEQGGASPEEAAAFGNAVQGFLVDPANTPGGTSGAFVGINLFNGQPLGLVDAPAATLRTEDTWEFGYKGLIADKLAVGLDVWNITIDGATLFTGISPTYILAGSDLGGDLATAIGETDVRDFMFNLLGGDANPAAGPTADAFLVAIQDAYAAGGAGLAPTIQFFSDNGILATTPTEQMPNVPGAHLAAGYRTFESYTYTGVDLGLEYYLNGDLSIFGNYSWISENIFEPVVVGTDQQTERTSNSIPLNKFRLGVNYAPEDGLRGSLAFQHSDSYEVFLGQFSGTAQELNLVDAALGYAFTNGVAIDVTAQNLFDNEYRQYPNFPKIGRRVVAKLTYDFGYNK